MKLLTGFFVLLFNLLILTTSASSPSNGCYRAAAYEHIVIGSYRAVERSDPLKYVRQNLKAFQMAAETARDEDAQIIVFPENGLFSAAKIASEESTSRDGTKLRAEDVPDPRESSEPIVPCGNKDFDDREILQTLSCIAKKNSIYLVADMGDIKNCANTGDTNCPEDGVYMYNTQVAFDRKGALIARYHKYHLYGESHYDTPAEQELIYFDTDIGVRVGMYICFDRLFRDPMISLIEQYNVTTMALSTWFMDEYPNLVSTQVDQGWSIALGINIVTANAKLLFIGTTGSGIYSPTHAISEHDSGRNKLFTKPKLIIGNLPVDPKSTTQCDPDPWTTGFSAFKVTPGQSYNHFKLNYSSYDSVPLTGGQGDNLTVCQGDFCCHLDYEFDDRKKEKDEADYVLAVTNGVRGYLASDFKTYEQICLLAAHDAQKATFPLTGARKFKRLAVRGTFDTKYVYPSALSDDLQLVPTEKVKLKSTSNNGRHERQLDVKFKGTVLTATLYGRVYHRDG